MELEKESGPVFRSLSTHCIIFGMKPSENKKSLTLLKLAITIGLFIILFQFIDVDAFWQTVIGANVWLLIPLIAFWPIAIGLSALKWKWILGAYGVPISFKKAFSLYWIGGFFNNFLPTSFGGDLYKYLSLGGEQGEKKSAIASSMILERGLGGITQIGVAGLVAILFLPDIWKEPILGIGLSMLTVLAIGAGIVLFSKRKITISRTFKLRHANTLRDWLNTFFSFPNRRILVASLGVSIAFVALMSLNTFIVFHAFHSPVPFDLLLFAVPFVGVVSQIPISINALGLREGLGVYIFSLFAISPEITLSVYLVNRVMSVASSSTGGIGFALMKK